MSSAQEKVTEVTKASIAVFLVIAIVLTLVTWAIEKTTGIGAYGLEFPLVGFLLGLAISVTLKPPREIFKRLNPWIPIDASLIILGLLAGFDRLGAFGGQAGIIVVANLAAALVIGMFLAYKLGLDERFSATFVSGGSICGISAAIATGRAANAEFAHLVIAMLLIAIVGSPFAIALALLAPNLGNVGGALVGGVVDGTPVVRAIAANLPEKLAEIALGIKYAQNCLIPIVVIILAYVASRLGGYEARLPLAVLLMLIGSAVSTFITLPPSIEASLHAARNWLLAFAMVLAGMATPIEALKKPGVKAAILVFIVIEIVNIVVVYALASQLLA
ncbi:MAG TPA: putative sulfate exporter family transporter [Pyrodictium sp.]|nr:putative sulfate exporter family transporter [Pyrodictium sp.]